MFDDLTKAQKRALREAAAAAHARDRRMSREDRDAFYLEARSAELPIIVGGAVANGILAIEDVAEPARDLVGEVAERLRAVTEASELSSRQQPEVPRYDPDAVVSLSAVVAEVAGATRQRPRIPSISESTSGSESPLPATAGRGSG